LQIHPSPCSTKKKKKKKKDNILGIPASLRLN